MDEQMTQQQPMEATSAEQGSAEWPEYEAEPEATSVDVPEGTEPEVSIDDNGEVKFRDDFFGDVKDEPDEPEPEQPSAPQYYTEDELRATPYEQWDVNRLPEQFRQYAEIVRGQLEQRRSQQQAQVNIQQRPTVPPGYVAPKQYTPKELAEAAKAAAMEKLGITDADEFDDYEAEHQAAMQMAMQELSQKDYAAKQEYARVTREYQDLQRFNDEIARRPDYGEFNQWFNARMKAEGLTSQQVNEALQRAVDAGGGNNWGAVQRAVTQWYGEFLASKQQARRPVARAQRPPVLESSGGSEHGRGSMNLREFGDMDIDRQAEALMRMGIV